MSEPTQRWQVQDSASVAPSAAQAETPAPPEPLALTLVSDAALVRPVMAPPVTFPGYEILGELGRGGMGVVYKARQRNLNRLVALKVILGGPLASPEDKARFHIEAEAAARLHHPNIVQVYDVGEYAGFSYMALELVEGRTVRQWQNGTPIEPKVAAKLVASVARAIQHAHEQGIVHRDLKPANILLAPVSASHPELGANDSAALPTQANLTVVTQAATSSSAVPLSFTPKVTDFGLAKALEGGSDLTVTGVACGTPNYMAPEQVRGKAHNLTVDVYGLGAVLYELLAGRPPFVGTDATELMNQILKAEPQDVRKFAPAVPRDLAVIVAKCLEKDPARRYASAGAAADDLERFLAGKPIAARPVGIAERTWRWVRRNPVAAAFLVVTSVGCIVTGSLALALGRAEADQRHARASAELEREEAERQRTEAEKARDGMRNALSAAEAARQLAEMQQKAAAEAKVAAEAAREEAKQEANRALAKQREANEARIRAEDNLRVARGVIRTSLRELSRHPRFEDDDFRGARQTLIEQVRPFRDTVAKHAPNTPEWLDDIADVSHWLGFLEYLNGNHNKAAAEYRTAADAAGRWAKLQPEKVEPRSRQSHSLVNAGNALRNAGRPADAESCYLDAANIIDAVVTEVPKDVPNRQQAIEVYGHLVRLYHALAKPAEAEKAAQQQLDRARELVRVSGETPDFLMVVATARLDLARAQTRLKKWEQAEREFTDAVAVYSRVRELSPIAVRPIVEYASAVASLVNCQVARGAPERAEETFLTAVERVEKAQTAAPTEYAPGLAVSHIWTQYADFLRARKKYDDAERRYDQAVSMMTTLVRRAPSFRPGREALTLALIGRAQLYNQTERHREAAVEWTRLVIEDPDPRARARHELAVLRSLLAANDWKAAVTASDSLMKKDLPGWLWLEVARIWCLLLKQVEADAALEPADRLRETDAALTKAVTCLEKARAVGEFNNPERLRWYTTNPEFNATRSRFDPRKK